MSRTGKLVLVSVTGALAAGVFAAGGVFMASRVMAAVNNTYPLLVQNIASKFNLNPADVAQVFKDTRGQELNTRLDQAVTDKVITSEQKQMILDEYNKVATQLENIRNQNLSQQDRATQLNQLRTQVEQWITDNKLPSQVLRYILPGKGMGRGMHGMGSGMMRGYDNDNDNDTNRGY